jgi:ATP-dependent Lon protease
MATAMVSALLRVAVRQNIAMTGEITLRGRVLPIGGLKEKILAAHRAGATTVVIPDENKKDMKDIPEAVLEQLAVIPVKSMDEVLRTALAVDNPEEFLREPSHVVDWRVVETQPPATPDDAH